ncbi:MAG TPA: hypothetical protein VFK65_26455 [Candidatus Binatia bacterium]|nr:hypothetical protein [Candidatus Binatia bacterium]
MKQHRMDSPGIYLVGKSYLLAIISIALVSCGSAGPRPLSIKMYNAEKNTTLDCAARDLGHADRNLLADTVENCARQLEKSGFVRQSSTP